MADNDLLVPARIARMTLGALVEELVLPRLVSRDSEVEFSGKGGTVVNVRVPATVTGGGARTYTQTQRDASTPIILDRIAETTVPLTMGPELYKGVPITDSELTFELDDFEGRIVSPLAQVVGMGAEAALVAVMNAVAPDASSAPALTGADIHDKIINIRMILNKRNVPQNGRILAVSPEIEAMLLRDAQNRLVRYDASGSTEALRNANVGRLYGFDIYVSNALTANSLIAFQREAFTFATRAPIVPTGVQCGNAINWQGFALRVHRDYDSAFLQDRVIVATFAGAAVVDAQRIVRAVAA